MLAPARAAGRRPPAARPPAAGPPRFARRPAREIIQIIRNLDPVYYVLIRIIIYYVFIMYNVL